MSSLVLPPEQRIRQRYSWLQEAARLGNVSLACQRLSVSRRTCYKWKRRSDAARGERTALVHRSRRWPPRSCATPSGARRGRPT